MLITPVTLLPALAGLAAVAAVCVALVVYEAGHPSGLKPVRSGGGCS